MNGCAVCFVDISRQRGDEEMKTRKRGDRRMEHRGSMSIRFQILTLVTLLTFFPCSSLTASIAVYVGKNLTKDGSVLLAGYGDEASSHWLEIVPRRKHAPGSTITVGVTARGPSSRAADRHPAGGGDVQIHHHELLLLGGVSRAADQRWHERASCGGPRRGAFVATGVGTDDSRIRSAVPTTATCRESLWSERRRPAKRSRLSGS